MHENGKYKAEDLSKVKEYKALINGTNNILSGAIEDNKIPAEMLQSLQEDVFIFSALKTNAQLVEASKLLMTEDNKVKSFAQFSKDIDSIKSGYNQKYLESEYQFAVTSAQMAGKWAEIDNDYLLQYRTASDDRVRKTHKDLHDITLPTDDPFWISYYPPNGWRCRCNAVQVRAGKFADSDSKKSIAAGEAATSQIGKDGKNKLELFRFNPGLAKVVFPPNHPYNKVEGAQIVKKLSNDENRFTILKNLKTNVDVSNVMGDFAEKNPEYYAHGYQFTKSTSKKNVNGYTTMRGDIYLKTDRLALVKDGLNNIRAGRKTTFEQEDALSTLHHEMWHNANKPGNMRSTTDQTKSMELANEYVSRKTLPDFMKKLGGELQNDSLTTNRKSTGYNKMVRNYDALVEWSKADKAKVLETVKNHLINGKYTEQIYGLVKAIKDHSEFELKDGTIASLINYAKDNRIDEDNYEALLKRNNSLLVKKRR